MPTFDPSKPLLVFGGPYSNLGATQAMRQRAEALSIPPGNVICTGDVVAYCAAPPPNATPPSAHSRADAADRAHSRARNQSERVTGATSAARG